MCKPLISGVVYMNLLLRICKLLPELEIGYMQLAPGSCVVSEVRVWYYQKQTVVKPIQLKQTPVSF